jgi:O-antigen/teichoic acid export membrane protein
VYIGNALLFLAIGALFYRQLSGLLDLPPVAVFLLVLGSFSSAVITLYNTRISLDYAYKKYLLVSACSSISNVGFSLLLILTAFRDQRALGRMVGSIVPLFVIAIIILLSFFRKEKPRPSKTYWRFGVKYSLPIIPHGISQVLLNQFGRIMIRNMEGDGPAGIYSLAGNIKLVLTIITDSIATAWNTWFYSHMDKGDKKAIQQRSVQLMGLFFILTVGLMALSPELVFILGGKGYDQAKFVAIPMILDAFILFLYNIIVPSEYYSKKTTFIMVGTMVAAGINIALNYIFIQRFGFLAVGYTTLFAYVCYLVLHIIISRKLVKFFVLPLRWIAVVCLALAGLAACNLLLINSLLLRWGLCAVVVIPVALVLLRNFAGGDIKQLLRK